MLQYRESREDSKILRPHNRNTAHVECKNICDTSNNRDNLNHLKTIQKITEQHTGKERNQGTTENSHTGHGTRTNIKLQNIQHGKYLYAYHKL